MVTVWSKVAREELRKAYLYIRNDSLQNAEMVRDDIINITISLSKFPEKFPLDKFKKDNDGTWRAFEKHHFRVSTPVQVSTLEQKQLQASTLAG